MDVFMIPGWDFILVGLRWLYEPQGGVPRHAEGYRPVNHRYRPRFVRGVHVRKYL